ncbi:hypothetical protein ETB97_004218 [Aspergillus alliaceus]|uniref:NAD(P)-binding protein n=1 Tax=Petromyces alliaceus TaxID=209559 RepID=A0A8H6AFF1_PETAA|nr:hypothetical protein ETB97_004218 [Aspergillus burnettii]
MHDNVLSQISLKGKIVALMGGARGVGLEACLKPVPTSRKEFGHGRLDVVVANAGVCTNSPNLEYSEETWRRDSSANYVGAMWTAQAAGKIFKRQGKGNLIITASVSSILVTIPQTPVAYNASKAAVVHLTKSLPVEWSDFARVNCISPGFIMTKRVDGEMAKYDSGTENL